MSCSLGTQGDGVEMFLEKINSLLQAGADPLLKSNFADKRLKFPDINFCYSAYFATPIKYVAYVIDVFGNNIRNLREGDKSRAKREAILRDFLDLQKMLLRYDGCLSGIC